jgi:hypothetical protein
MRDGDTGLRNEQEAWARSVFMSKLARPPDGRGVFPDTVGYNPLAIAVVGFAHLLKHRPDPCDLEQLLMIAAGFSRAGAPGFTRVAPTLS